ncbi:MAG: hypothetical protein WD379_02195 [Dehalococcoidia bacterium]
MPEINPWAAVIYSRALSSHDPNLVQIRFHVTVLDVYRERGLDIKRTETVGRLRKAGGWSIDFGIGEGERTIHASFGDLMGLPEEELRHWAGHVAQSDLSESFCKMRLHPGSCIEDGELRDW